MIEAEDLTYDYAKTRALDGASFSAPAGEITALVGPNGAGKTTLMRVLAGLQRPHGGRAMVGGVDVGDDPRAVHRLVAFTPDFIGLYDGLTAARHLLHFGRCADLSSQEAWSRAKFLAERLTIEDLLERDAAEMSRGQRQRLAIAQALMKHPKILILDEPASGLDPEARRGLSDLLLALKADGVTMLVSSHILSELDDYSDRVVVMRDGKVVRAEALTTAPSTDVVTITLASPTTAFRMRLTEAAPHAKIVEVNERSARIQLAADPTAKAETLAALIGAGLPVSDFTVKKRRLADAYFDAPDAKEAAR